MPTDLKIKPIKKLGQNFLRDENILRRIADAARLNSEDIVVEIGTGTGNLTKYLCEKAKYVYTVEIDKRLCKIAEENLTEFNNVKVICADILKLGKNGDCPNPNSFLSLKGLSPFLKLKVIGNLPYYITTPIIFHLLNQRQYISDIFVMVQKEVARRIAANPGNKDYGILTCSAQYYTKPQILFDVKKAAFSPQPKVDSSFMRLSVLDEPSVKVKDEQLFFKIIKTAFNQRRKMLSNSLSRIISRDALKNLLHKAGICPKSRPEDLSLKELVIIADLLHNDKQ